jgi:hypothetical protein
MRPTILIGVLMLMGSRATFAQLAVHDPAVTARNTMTAIVQEYLLNTEREQHRQLRRMARRLSEYTSLEKYAVPDPPRWRTHGGDLFEFSQAYNDALIFGDPAGDAYLALSEPVVAAENLLARLSPTARRVLAARLATLDLTAATAIAGTNDTGQLRYNGRKRELPAINALEDDVIDPSNDQSATAVLDKISGAVLIGARQRQVRTQLLVDLVEELLVESKRTRDADAASIGMQLVTWRDSRAANAAFAAGMGDALRTWRQP